MREWNLGELITELKFIINANTGVTDQAVAGESTDIDVHYRNALSEAYADEVEEAMQTSDVRYFTTTTTMAWPNAQLTLDVRPYSEFVIYKVEDITDNDPGDLMWFSQWAEQAVWSWKDRSTIQWGSTGPSSDRTIRFTHIEEPQDLVEDLDVPDIIPRRFRHLVAWSAAIILRVIMDEKAPQHFIRRRDDIRARYHKALAMGKPMQTGQPGTSNGGAWDVGSLGGGIGP